MADIVTRLRSIKECLRYHDCIECESHFGRGCSCQCHEQVWCDAADEIERLRAETDLLQLARQHLRRLLDEFVDICTEEQHSVEMLCLHRAAMKPDPWERAQSKETCRG